MNIFIFCVAGFLSGAAGALGLGGGGVLIIYLTVFAGTAQLKAQGINLIFFIPAAVIAVLMHTKNKLIKWKRVLPCIAGGLAGAVSGFFLGNILGAKYLRMIFALMLLFLGVKEIFSKQRKTSV